MTTLEDAMRRYHDTGRPIVVRAGQIRGYGARE